MKREAKGDSKTLLLATGRTELLFAKIGTIWQGSDLGQRSKSSTEGQDSCQISRKTFGLATKSRSLKGMGCAGGRAGMGLLTHNTSGILNSSYFQLISKQ